MLSIFTIKFTYNFPAILACFIDFFIILSDAKEDYFSQYDQLIPIWERRAKIGSRIIHTSSKNSFF